MAELAINPHTISMILNHVSARQGTITSKVYVQYSYDRPAHAGDARADQGLVAGELEGKAVSGLARRWRATDAMSIPNGRSRHPAANVPWRFCGAYNLGNFLRTLATPEPIKDWFADEPAGKTREDRRQGRAPRSLCRLPNGRSRHPTPNVPGDFAAHCRAAGAATTSASVRRAMVMRFKFNRSECVQVPGKMASSCGDMGHTGVKVSELISGCLNLRGRFLSSNAASYLVMPLLI